MIGFIGNLVLTLIYFEHKRSIQCEPCLPNYPCSPCQTEFMKNVIWYYVVFNALIIVFYFIFITINKEESSINKH